FFRQFSHKPERPITRVQTTFLSLRRTERSDPGPFRNGPFRFYGYQESAIHADGHHPFQDPLTIALAKNRFAALPGQPDRFFPALAHWSNKIGRASLHILKLYF